MLLHYFSTVLRHFRRHKLTTAINIVCLSIGLVCFIGVHGFARILESSDLRLRNAERVVSITHKISIPGAASSIPETPVTTFSVAKYLKADFPELESVARESTATEVAVTARDVKTRLYVRYADPNLFDIVALPFVAGDRSQALERPLSAVLSRETAVELFGDPTRAIGKRVMLYGNVEVTVTGVLDSIPQPSHLSTNRSVNPQLRVDLFVSFDVFEASDFGKVMATNWNSPTASVFAMLPRDNSITLASLRQRLQTFDERHVPKGEWKSEFGAIPLSKQMAGFGNALVGAEKTGLTASSLLYLLGALVLLVSCINYANLAAAQASTQAKEVGMLRVVGASRLQVVVQHLFEACVMSVLAFSVALVLVVIGLASLRLDGSGYLIRNLLSSSSTWFSSLGLLVLVTLAAGAYPSFIFSRVRPLQAVRMEKSHKNRLAALLVCGQFAAASFLLVVILVMMAQGESVKRSAFSSVRAPLVVLSNLSGVKFETLRSELLRQPHVKSVSGTYVQLWGLGGAIASVSTVPDAGASKTIVSQERVYYDFAATLDLKLLAGRDFARDRGGDEVNAIVIDRNLSQQVGWSTPEQAIDRSLYLWRPGTSAQPPEQFEVIGVVENRTTRLLGMGATSNIFYLRPQMMNFPIIRLDTANIAQGVQEVDDVWSRLAPSIAIKRQFADELLNRNMAIFDIISTVFANVASLALLIAALGLLGMSIQIISRRKHEIGVRKTLGASVRSVVMLLLKDFSKPVVIANLVAWPLAYLSMQVYLSMFTQRVGLSPTPFIASLLLTVGIAWLAVTAQAIRAARLKPASVLKYE